MLLTLACLANSVALAPTSSTHMQDSSIVARSAPCTVDPPAAMEHQPLHLIENRGQFDTDARYVGEAGGGLVRVEPKALLLQLMRPGRASGVLLRLSFTGASDSVRLQADESCPARFSYFQGDDSDKWIRAVPAFAEVRYCELWPGVDLLVKEQQNHLKYDLELAPGADLSQIVLRVEGAQGLSIDGAGNLILDTQVGSLIQPPAQSFERLASGEKRPLVIRYRTIGEDSFGFDASARDSSVPLVVDPGLIWSTYIGGATNLGDIAYGVDILDNGDVFVAGKTGGP